MEPNGEYGGEMLKLEDELALVWLEEQLAALGHDGHPRSETILDAVREDLRFEMHLLRYASYVEGT